MSVSGLQNNQQFSLSQDFASLSYSWMTFGGLFLLFLFLFLFWHPSVCVYFQYILRTLGQPFFIYLLVSSHECEPLG
jgi:hypothetical protein